jgi:hypothetical protein
MEFRTVIGNIDNQGMIQHSHNIMLIGSCFSDNIGNKLKRALMNVEINPFGTVYNPASILGEIERIVDLILVDETELFMHNGMWHHYGFHSKFSSDSAEKAMSKMNKHITSAHNHLKHCDFVIITLGTAFVYEAKSLGKIVSNCHKVPAKEFNRFLLSFEHIRTLLDTIVTKISNFAPHAKIIFTVSPIRHIGDGLEQNQLSKSLLRAAVGETIAANHNACIYFPAYEIMMDDLRDYRFYASDMAHPTEQAVDYIADKFFEAALSDSAQSTMREVSRVVAAAEHRPFNPACEEYKIFCRKQLDAIDRLQCVDLSKERAYFERMLAENV